MSKKHSSETYSSLSAAHAAEYKIIAHDLIKVVLLNALYLVAVIALFYAERSSHVLERWAQSIIHF